MRGSGGAGSPGAAGKCVRVQETAGQARGDHRVAAGHGTYAGEKFLGQRVLDEEAAGAGAQTVARVPVESELRDDREAPARIPVMPCPLPVWVRSEVRGKPLSVMTASSSPGR